MLTIGSKKFKTKKLNAKFPIDFYKETNIDIFAIESYFQNGNMLGAYEALLYLAYHSVEFEGTIDEFADEISKPADIFDATEHILSIFSENSKGKSKSADKSKK